MTREGLDDIVKILDFSSSCEWADKVSRWRNVKVSDMWSRACGFNSFIGHYHVVTSWMGDYLVPGKSSRYI